MAVKKETYSQAMERLEKIVRQIDNNELDIDILSEKIKEANEIDRKSTRLNSSHSTSSRMPSSA